MQALELKVPPLLLVGVVAGAMLGFSRLFPSAHVQVPGGSVAALAIAMIGVGVALAGVLCFRANKTTVNPLTPAASSMLVCSGIYRYSRNPMYLGFLLVLTGWAVHLSNGSSILMLLPFIFYMNRFQIQPEERALLAKFGPRYTEYMTTVRRWI